ncbi:MAG: hypothetical protein FWG52_08915 [Proteobacteria bacterium]|jgi:hypothetical protein|nr:hypothetical protein [Pseudomonadota bacterium]
MKIKIEREISMGKLARILVIVSVFVAVLVGILWFGFWKPERDVRNAVAAQLFDSDSARFRNILKSSIPKYKDRCFCGEVNAKNKMGGYTGYKFFLVCRVGADAEWGVINISDALDYRCGYF